MRLPAVVSLANATRRHRRGGGRGRAVSLLVEALGGPARPGVGPEGEGVRAMKARTALQVGAGVLVVGAVAWALWPAPLAVEVSPRRPGAPAGDGGGAGQGAGPGPVRGGIARPGPPRADHGTGRRPGPGRRRPGGGPPGHAGAPRRAHPARSSTARLEATRAAEAEAAASEERARHASEQASRERERMRALAAAGSVTPRDLDAAETAADGSVHALEAAGAAVLRARREVQAAQALLDARGGPGGRGVEVRAPAPGRVLRVLQESEGPVAAGAPLLEVGDPDRIELRVDLLTSEAVRVAPGAAVDLVNWGGDRALRRRGCGSSSPPRSPRSRRSASRSSGSTSSSTRSSPAPGRRSSDGYAVDGPSWWPSGPDALLVPAGALFREDGGLGGLRRRRRAGPPRQAPHRRLGRGSRGGAGGARSRATGCSSTPATR